MVNSGESVGQYSWKVQAASNVCAGHLNHIKVIYGIFSAFVIKKVKMESEFCGCCSLK